MIPTIPREMEALLAKHKLPVAYFDLVDRTATFIGTKGDGDFVIYGKITGVQFFGGELFIYMDIGDNLCELTPCEEPCLWKTEIYEEVPEEERKDDQEEGMMYCLHLEGVLTV